MKSGLHCQAKNVSVRLYASRSFTTTVRADVILPQMPISSDPARGAVSFVTGRGMAVHDGGSVNRRHLGQSDRR